VLWTCACVTAMHEIRNTGSAIG